MSYARFIEGDVYVYGTHLHGDKTEGFTCCACLLIPARWVEDDGILGGHIESVSGEPLSFDTESRAEMILHLRRHQAAGHDVPDRAFEGLAEEKEWGKP